MYRDQLLLFSSGQLLVHIEQGWLVLVLLAGLVMQVQCLEIYGVEYSPVLLTVFAVILLSILSLGGRATVEFRASSAYE